MCSSSGIKMMNTMASPNGLGRLGRLPPELRLMIWRHLSAPRVVSRHCDDPRLDERLDRTAWWPMWRISKTIACEFLPLLYDRTIIFRPRANFEEFEVEACSSEEVVSRFLAYIRPERFPMAATKDRETCRYMDVQWFRFQSIVIEIDKILPYARTILARAWMAYGWLVSLLGHAVDRRGLSLPHISIVAKDSTSTHWMTQNALLGTGGRHPCSAQRPVPWERISSNLHALLIPFRRLRRCESVSVVTPELGGSISYAIKCIESSATKQIAFAAMPPRQSNQQWRKDCDVASFEDCCTLEVWLYLDNAEGQLADMDRLKLWSEWTHQTTLEWAKVLFGRRAGTLGGAHKLVSAEKAAEFSRSLYRNMEEAQIYDLLAPLDGGFQLADDEVRSYWLVRVFGDAHGDLDPFLLEKTI